MYIFVHPLCVFTGESKEEDEDEFIERKWLIAE
jgi:hypothetical protein